MELWANHWDLKPRKLNANTWLHSPRLYLSPLLLGISRHRIEFQVCLISAILSSMIFNCYEANFEKQQFCIDITFQQKHASEWQISHRTVYPKLLYTLNFAFPSLLVCVHRLWVLLNQWTQHTQIVIDQSIYICICRQLIPTNPANILIKTLFVGGGCHSNALNC